MREITTCSQTETAAVGRELAAGVGPGDVLLLYGDLGAGKTAFVKGLAEGLGIPRDDVSSPTFTLVQEYRGGRVPLFHVDLYRLNDPQEIEDLGLDEIAADGVLAIEWAEKLTGGVRRMAGRSGNVTAVRIGHGDADRRTIRIDSAPSEGH